MNGEWGRREEYFGELAGVVRWEGAFSVVRGRCGVPRTSLVYMHVYVCCLPFSLGRF